jgi:hypothetical protein
MTLAWVCFGDGLGIYGDAALENLYFNAPFAFSLFAVQAIVWFKNVALRKTKSPARNNFFADR